MVKPNNDKECKHSAAERLLIKRVSEKKKIHMMELFPGRHKNTNNDREEGTSGTFVHKNRFSVLAVKENPVVEEMQTAESESNISENRESIESKSAANDSAANDSIDKPMPAIVILDDFSNVAALKTLRGKCKSKVHVQYKGRNHYRVTTYRKTDFEVIIKELKSQKKKFYSYPLKEQANQKIVALGIPPSIPSEDIMAFLLEKYVRVKKVIQMTKMDSLNQRFNLPIYLIICDHEQDMTTLKNMNHILGYAVKWDKYRHNGNIIQCFNCQSFGHVSAYCNLKFRCVKCTEEHEPKECPKKRKIRHCALIAQKLTQLTINIVRSI